jgi:hypothetical protein
MQHTSRINDKNHILISLPFCQRKKKALTKIQHTFMTKALKKLRIEDQGLGSSDRMLV